METSILQTLPFYSVLTKEEVRLLDSDVRIASFEKGELIHRHGDDCVGMIYLISGRVCVSIISDEGREVALYRLEKGECCVLSASCVLRSIMVDFHIAAESQTRVMIVPTHTLSTLMRQNCCVEATVYKLAAGASSDILGTFQQILFQPVEQRLAEFLWKESARTRSDVLNVTHEQLAKYTGTAREVVTRMLKKLARRGAITVTRGTVTIVDKDLLKSLA